MLNAEQENASFHKHGPALVIAGAGSGKTKVIVSRAKCLIDSGVDPEKILVITFTNKACKELQARIKNERVHIYTFHRLGLNLLREFSDRKALNIYGREESVSAIKKLLVKSGLDASSAKDYYNVFSEIKKNVRSLVDQDKEAAIKESNAKQEMQLPDVKNVLDKYKKFCIKNNAVDLSDLVYETAVMLRNQHKVKEAVSNKWSHVMVDEYQDTSEVEATLISDICSVHSNLMVVGDPNQSIYEWRGARVGNILEFEKRFPNSRVFKLLKNYRSSNEILRLSNNIIQNSHSNLMQDKLIGTFSGNDPRIYAFRSDLQESEYVCAKIQDAIRAGDSIAVIYRTNSQSKVIENACIKNGIQYDIKGTISFREREEIKVFISYMKMVDEDYCNFLDFSKSLAYPKRGIGEKKLMEIENFIESEGIEVRQFIEKFLEEEKFVGIKLSKKQYEHLKEYAELLRESKLRYRESGIFGCLQFIMKYSGIKEFFLERDDKGTDRFNNIQHLVFAYKFKEISIGDFLDNLELGENIDNKNAGALLATIHSVKGLEFDIVMLCGVEEGILPHAQSFSLEEERRLFYVAATRAKKELVITRADARYINGSVRSGRQSSFMQELRAADYIEKRVCYRG